MLIEEFSEIINLTISLVAGEFKGASFSFQSGINSFNAVGSNTFPERM